MIDSSGDEYYYRVSVQKRYEVISAYISKIVIHYDYKDVRRQNPLYKVSFVVMGGINVPERVGRATYPYQGDGFDKLGDAQRVCISKVFKVK